MEKTFAIFLAYGFVYLLIVFPIASIVMSELTPESLIKQFLRPPHYKQADTVAYQTYPMKLHLGIHFSAMIAWPKLAKRRGIENAKEYAPKFWVVCSYIYQYCIFSVAVLFILMGFEAALMQVLR